MVGDSSQTLSWCFPGVPCLGVPSLGVPCLGVPCLGVTSLGVPCLGVPSLGVPLSDSRGVNCLPGCEIREVRIRNGTESGRSIEELPAQ